MRAEAILIDRPDRQSWWRRIGYAIITIVAWVIWILLWLPVLTIIAHALGLPDVYRDIILIAPLQNHNDLHVIGWLAMASAVIFASWSGYNRYRFSGLQRRQGNEPFGLTATAATLGASVVTAERLQSSRRSVVDFEEDGTMVVAALPATAG